MTMDEREIPVERHLWIIFGYRVWEITAWRVISHTEIITTVPGLAGSHPFILGENVFSTEANAYHHNMLIIDNQRRFLDDLAELNVRHLNRLRTAKEELAR